MLCYGTERRCDQCRKPSEQQKAKARARVKLKRYGSSDARGYGDKWRKVRATLLARGVLCVICYRQGREVRATEVDHVTPHGGDQRLFWDRSNWQVLCKPCHARKTLAETRARLRAEQGRTGDEWGEG